MGIYTESVSKLITALSKVEDRIILTSDKELSDREHAISELRYYKTLLESFSTYPEELQNSITVELNETLGVIAEWLDE
jgi:hypothetical protein